MPRSMQIFNSLSFLDGLLGRKSSFIDAKEGEISNRHSLPLIRRGRDYALYGQNGRRYLDLYRTDGYSLLGYSVPGLGNAVKSRVDQHLWAGMPHHSHGQVERALAKAYPGYEPFIVANWYTVEFLLKSLGLGLCPGFLPDQEDVWHDASTEISGSHGSQSFQIALPFLPVYADIAFAILPGLGYSGPFVLLIKDAVLAKLTVSTDQIANLHSLSSMVSPLIIASLLHTLPQLSARAGLPALPPVLENRVRPHDKTLGDFREATWESLALGSWRRRGPYLFHHFDPSEYQTVFQFALRQGVILNPRHEGLSILPGVLTRGEVKKIEDVLAFAPTLSI